VGSVCVTAPRRLQVPPESFFKIHLDTISLAKTKANRILSVKNAFRRSFELKPKSSFLIPRYAAASPIALAEEVSRRSITMFRRSP
jgi:hypothetical protein